MGASPTEIEQAERELRVSLPEDYRSFMAAEGAVARTFPPAGDFLMVHPVGDLVGINEAAGLADRLPGAVVIGGDGSRELLVYDFRHQQPPLVLVDATGGRWSDGLHQAASFTEFLSRFPDRGWLWE
jgi:hypothetical protein